MTHINSSINECTAMYNMTVTEQRLLKRAGALIASKMRNTKTMLDSVTAVISVARVYFTLTHAHKEREVFSVMYLDSQHQLIEIVDEFTGTIDSANVYPREIVKRALSLNAAALILVHNHPSGVAEPSSADQRITARLVGAMELVGVRILDHIIVGQMSTVSFAERGLM